MLRRGLGWKKVLWILWRWQRFYGEAWEEMAPGRLSNWEMSMGTGHGGEVRAGGKVSRGQSLWDLGKQVGETDRDPQSNGGASVDFRRGVI